MSETPRWRPPEEAKTEKATEPKLVERLTEVKIDALPNQRGGEPEHYYHVSSGENGGYYLEKFVDTEGKEIPYTQIVEQAQQQPRPSVDIFELPYPEFQSEYPNNRRQNKVYHGQFVANEPVKE